MADIASGDQRKKNCVSVRVMNSRGLDHFLCLKIFEFNFGFPFSRLNWFRPFLYWLSGLNESFFACVC